MSNVTMKISGLKELDVALGQLPKATAKGVLRRVLKAAAQPIATHASQLAPRDTLHLAESIAVSTRLNKRQRSLHKKERQDTFQEMFVGTNDPAGVQQEFGNERHMAQPFMRPAWDAEQMPTLDRIANSLWVEIDKSARRRAKRG